MSKTQHYVIILQHAKKYISKVQNNVGNLNDINIMFSIKYVFNLLVYKIPHFQRISRILKKTIVNSRRPTHFGIKYSLRALEVPSLRTRGVR